MLLNKLVLLETYPQKRIIRTVQFKKGMNYIVDAGEDQEKGNGVGKTTFLKLIDLCLGARGKKYIYTDFETGNDNTTLEEYITTSKIRVELFLSNVFAEKSTTTVLGVDLFKRGHKYIDGQKKNEADYNAFLNDLIFENEVEKPSFRMLIGMFVRINQKKDNDGFLKYLDDHTKVDDYNLAYSFLFNLQDQQLENTKYSIKQDIRRQEKHLASFKQLNNIKSADAINQKIQLMSTDIRNISTKLKGLVDSKQYLENEQKINLIKVNYAKLNDELDRAIYRIQKNKHILNEARNESSSAVNTSVLRELFEESKFEFKNLNKTFEELQQFNRALTQNKIAFFAEQIKKWTATKEKIEREKKELFDRHKNVIMLIEDNKIDEYTKLQNELGKVQEELGKNKQVLSTFDGLNESLSNSKKRLSELDAFTNSNTDQISKFNTYFSDYSKKLNGDEYILYKKENGFPLDIQPKHSKGLSTGTKKSLIAAFDLAYQSYAKSISKSVPNFIVHDVVETLDKSSFNALIELTNSLNCQYIVSVLRDKISSLNKYDPNDVILTLSEKESLFKK